MAMASAPVKKAKESICLWMDGVDRGAATGLKRYNP